MDADQDFEEFVGKLIGCLSSQVDRNTIRRSEDGNSLDVGSCHANLRSLFRTYVVSPEDGVDHFAALIVDSLARGDSENDIPDWTQAKEQIRPKLWSRLSMSGNDFGMPYKLVGEHLMLSVVLDHAHSMSVIPRSWLEQWEVSFDEALKIAFDHIAPVSQFMGVTSTDGSSGHCSTATNDCFDSARCLIETPYELFQIGYPRFAFPSARDICVMAMADQPKHLEFCIEMALELGDEDPKPLPPFPLVNEGDGWRNWQAVPGSVLDRMLARRQFVFLLNGYAEQTTRLQHEFDELGDFVLIESFRSWPGSSKEFPRSYTNWPAGAETLLPKTDCVVFPDHGNLRVDWNDLVMVCGQWLAPAEALYPPRWRTVGYPNEEQFARLDSLSLD